MQETQVPYSKLILSQKMQARKTGVNVESLRPLAASIKEIGLLQNMVVVKVPKKGTYEVVAGGRRYRAIGLLVEEGHFTPDTEFTVKVIEAKNGLTASLTENFQRADMTPADEFEAFATLIDQGFSVEDVAATFGLDVKHVQQRMKLARVAPALVQLYRDGEIKLGMLMAFALSEDHEQQLSIWQGLTGWQQDSPDHVRKLITQDGLTAQNKQVRFVGLEAYQQAGGAIRHDLFIEGPKGVYIEQPELVTRLAVEKLQAEADKYLAEGWSWAEPALTLEWEDQQRYGHVGTVTRALTADEQAQVDALEPQIEALEAQMGQMEENDDDGDVFGSEPYQNLDTQRDELQAQLNAIHEEAEFYSDEGKSISGVIVTLDYEGELVIHLGMIRPEDRKAAVQAAKQQGGKSSAAGMTLPQAKTRPVHSEKLVNQLLANKTGIVAAALLDAPDAALAILTAHLAQQTFSTGLKDKVPGVGIDLTTSAFHIKQAAADFEGSKADQALAAARQHWLDQLPNDEHGDILPLVPWALAQDKDTLIELLTFCVASSINGLPVRYSHPADLDSIAHVIDVDPAQWWAPTADTYLSSVSKDRIVEIVTDAVDPVAAAPLLKMKKGQAAAEAEKLLAGKGWLPDELTVKPKQADEQDAE